MLATVALAGAASSQSRQLVNRAVLFQQVSIVTGLGWLTALSAPALTRTPATRTRRLSALNSALATRPDPDMLVAGGHA